MTKTPELLPMNAPKRQRAKRVLFVAFPDVGLLDLTGAQTVFWAATKAMEARGLAGYERCTASLDGGLVRSAEGLVLQTDALAAYRGALLVVSHDERFLDRLGLTRRLELTRDGLVEVAA